MMPFAGGIEATANATLLFSLAAAVVYGLILNTRETLLRSAVKTLAVALLAALAFTQAGPLLLVAALALSALGDAFLSRDGDKAFLGGLASFLAAHLAYIALFFLAGGGWEFLAEPWRVVLAVAMAAFAAGMLVMLWRRVAPDLRLPVAAYAAAILGMGVSALTLDNVWIIVGAVLFMASDGLLAAEKFLIAAISRHREWMRHAVWALYYAAQLMITLGFLL
ncbi:lysoplasmalogenase [Allomesorhizobium camelthorni]|uniref:Lysoplasmalogenase n=1 Tax=Allomesorhizobium camelthorni TaxID=475069 RepID=A0A6G4WHF5_9HYPH|nr:lysoplasmalogenase [Mesorhizobium camelthorni]NGO53527.1 lysoplasmalogenase [Mesorhizobium camelthorni]